MKTGLPESIEIYFRSCNDEDIGAFERCFSSMAKVRDEAVTHRGIPAIQAWMREAQSRYAFQVETLDWQKGDAVFSVPARVSGRFSGSPVELKHEFHLVNGLIESLEIHA
jgi:hypothetical protein